MMADAELQVREVPSQVVPENAGETESLPEVQEPVLGPSAKTCRKCHVVLTPTNQIPSAPTTGRWICRNCERSVRRKINQRRWRRIKADPKVLDRTHDYNTRWKRSNPQRRTAITHRYRFKVFVAAMMRLGGKCAMCPETDLRKLTIDHIHGGGRSDPLRQNHSTLLKAIATGRVPPDKYQCLCFNCNCGVKRREWMSQFLDERGFDVGSYV